MDKLTDEELGTIVDAEFTSSMGAEGGEIAEEREKALDYYHSRAVGVLSPVEGQSQVVSSDVADVVDGIMPSLLRIFTTADNLVNFDAVGKEDVESASQTSDYVNYVFFKQNDAFNILRTWMLDAVLQKNGYVKAWWDDSEEVTQEKYTNLTEGELFDLLEDEELEIDERSEHEEDFNGQPVIVHDVTFNRVSKAGRVRVENVPPEEFRISSDARKLDPSDARFVGHEREFKRHELIEMGFDEDVVEDLPSGNEHGSETRQDKTDDTTGGSHDHSQDEILLREGYIRIDADRDGRAELIQVFTAGNTDLSAEPVDRQPFHALCPLPSPHKHFGQSLADKVMPIQDITSTLTRQGLDNIYAVNNPGQGVWEQAIGDNTLDDLLNTRLGSVKRFTRPPGEAYMPIVTPPTSQGSFQALSYFDKIKRDRTGVNSDSEGLEPDALKHVREGVMNEGVDQSKMKIEAIARVFAETGIKTLFLHIHELLMKHQDKEKIVRLRNKFVPVDPSGWKHRSDMTVNIGLGIGTRETNLRHLEAIWNKQAQIVQSGGGGVLVTLDNIFNTASEFVKNANMKDPEKFFSNPEGKNAPPPNQEQIALQKQQQELIAKQQKQEAEKLALDQQKVALRHKEEMLKIQQNQDKMAKDFQIDNEKLRNDLTEMELKFNKDIPGGKA